jgi:hypothetical protein
MIPPKMSQSRQTMKTEPGAIDTAKTSSRAQNKEIRLDALSIAQKLNFFFG